MARPIIIENGRLKQASGDLEIQGVNFTLDSDNVGAGADVNIIAEQGSDSNGTLRYNATDNRWEISNDGGAYEAISTGTASDTFERSGTFSVPEGNATLEEANFGIAAYAGSLIGVAIICDDAVTAGTITVNVKVAGATKLTAVLNTTDTTKQVTTAAVGTYAVAVKDSFTVEVITAGGYTNAATDATNLDIRFTTTNDSSASSGSTAASLDDAYNGGVTITVDAGAVVLAANTVDASQALTITREPGSSAAAVGASITMGSNATGDGLVVTHNGSGDAISTTGDVTITGKLTVTGVIDPTALKLTEQASDPASTGAGEGTIYVKNTIPSTLIFVDDVGAEITLGAGGGEANSLDTAYDNGSTITVDAGAIVLDADTADATAAFSITREPASGIAVGMSIVMGANSSGDSIKIDHNGGGAGISILYGGPEYGLTIGVDGTSVFGRAATFGESGGTIRSEALVSMLRDTASTGAVLSLVNGGEGVALIANTTGSSDSQVMVLTESAVARTNPMIAATRSSSALGVLFQIDNDGSGNAVDINQSGAGDAVNIALDSNTSAQALAITSSVATTADIVNITSSTTGATGTLLALDKAPGTATSGNGLDIAMGANCTGFGLLINQDGSGDAFQINHSGSGDAIGILLDGTATGAEGIVIGESGATVRNNPLIDITRSSTSTGVCLFVDNNSTNSGIQVNQDGASGSAILLRPTGTNARGLEIDVSGSAATGINVNDTGATSGIGIFVAYVGAASTGDGIRVDKDPSSSAGGRGVYINMGANSTGIGLHVTTAGSGNAITASGPVDITGDVGITGKLTVSGLIDPTGLKLAEQSADPGSTGAGEGTIYVKDTVPSTLVFVDDVGGEITLGAGGGEANSLDTAYDNGSTVTVDAGAVTLAANATTSTAALAITREPASGSGHQGINLTMGANATGAGMQMDNNGSGNAIDINQGGVGNAINITLDSSAGAQAMVVTSSVANTSSLVSLTQNTTGATGNLLNLNKSPSTSTSGILMSVTAGANTTADALRIAQNGSGPAVQIFQIGSGMALEVNCSADTGNQALVITTTANNTSSLVSIAQTSGAATGDFLNIDKSPDTASTGGRGIAVNMGSNTTGIGLQITQGGTGRGIQVTTSNASADSALVAVTSSGTGSSVVSFSNTIASGTATVCSVVTGGGATNSATGLSVLTGSSTTGTAASISSSGTGVALAVGGNGSATAQTISPGTSGIGLSIVSNITTGDFINLSQTTGTNSPDMLVISKTPSGSAGGSCIDLTMGTSATGTGFQLTENGGGTGMRIDQDGAGFGLIVDIGDIAARGIVVQSAVASGLVALMEVKHTGAGGDATCLSLAKNVSASGAGSCLSVNSGSNHTGHSILISNDGSANAISVNQSGAGVAFEVDLDSSASAQALVIVSSVASTASIASITSSTNSATGTLLDITKSPSSSTAGDGVVVTMGANTTGDGIDVTMTNGATGAAFRGSGQAGTSKSTLTDAATIATDCADGNVFEVTLAGNRTLGAPTNPIAGFTYIWIINQDATGTRTLAYNAVFDFPGGTAPVLSTGASDIDLLCGVYNGTSFLSVMNQNFS